MSMSMSMSMSGPRLSAVITQDAARLASNLARAAGSNPEAAAFVPSAINMKRFERPVIHTGSPTSTTPTSSPASYRPPAPPTPVDDIPGGRTPLTPLRAIRRLPGKKGPWAPPTPTLLAAAAASAASASGAPWITSDATMATVEADIFRPSRPGSLGTVDTSSEYSIPYPYLPIVSPVTTHARVLAALEVDEMNDQGYAFAVLRDYLMRDQTRVERERKLSAVERERVVDRYRLAFVQIRIYFCLARVVPGLGGSSPFAALGMTHGLSGATAHTPSPLGANNNKATGLDTLDVLAGDIPILPPKTTLPPTTDLSAPNAPLPMPSRRAPLPPRPMSPKRKASDEDEVMESPKSAKRICIPEIRCEFFDVTMSPLMGSYVSPIFAQSPIAASPTIACA